MCGRMILLERTVGWICTKSRCPLGGLIVLLNVPLLLRNSEHDGRKWLDWIKQYKSRYREGYIYKG